MLPQLVMILFGALAICVLAFTTVRYYREALKLRTRYSHLIEPEAELVALTQQLDQVRHDKDALESQSQLRRAKLDEEYNRALDQTRHDQEALDSQGGASYGEQGLMGSTRAQ